MGNVGSERGTCKDDGKWKVKQERENKVVLKSFSANGADGGCAREKMVTGREKTMNCKEDGGCGREKAKSGGEKTASGREKRDFKGFRE